MRDFQWNMNFLKRMSYEKVVDFQSFSKTMAEGKMGMSHGKPTGCHVVIRTVELAQGDILMTSQSCHGSMRDYHVSPRFGIFGTQLD
jgi:hypothetical protein